MVLTRFALSCAQKKHVLTKTYFAVFVRPWAMNQLSIMYKMFQSAKGWTTNESSGQLTLCRLCTLCTVPHCPLGPPSPLTFQTSLLPTTVQGGPQD